MNYKKQADKAYILLADGTVLEGKSFGAKGTKIGEVVFTTSMTGYQETLTDPSYYGQIVIQTFPLIGNYGINSEDKESEKIWVNGYIVREYCEVPSNFRCENDIDSFLKEHQVIGIYNIDTRSLTRKIRELGVINGAITTENVYEKKDQLLEEIKAFTINDAVLSVTNTGNEEFKAEDPKCNVVLIDYGAKANMIRILNSKGCNVTTVPCRSTAEEILALNPDGIMLSNGPGDPAENEFEIDVIAKLCKSGVPIFGICLGHQMMALANGAKTEKLKYGHRGANQPVKELATGKTFITSQNHGYAVVGDSIPKEIGEVSHINANDKTCEGVRYNSFNGLTVQFHPEACGGPHDTDYLFDQFISMMKGESK